MIFYMMADENIQDILTMGYPEENITYADFFQDLGCPVICSSIEDILNDEYYSGGDIAEIEFLDKKEIASAMLAAYSGNTYKRFQIKLNRIFKVETL